jgi:hypothetical protein
MGKTIAIDMDGVLCTEERTFEKPLAKVIPGAVEGVNSLFERGHTIIIWTARGWEQFAITDHWLKLNGFKYHMLQMGKPIVDYFIDDRAITFKSWPIDL